MKNIPTRTQKRTHSIFNFTTVSFFLLLWFFLLFPKVVFAATLAKEYKIDFASALPQAHLSGEACLRMAKTITELSSGKITFNMHMAGSLYGHKDLPEAIMNGSVQMGVGSAALGASYNPVLLIAVCPFAFDNYKQVDQFYSAKGEFSTHVNRIMEPMGFKLLGWSPVHELDGIANRVRPIKQMADLEGLKIRATGTLIVDAFKAAGADCVVISSAEAYSALERGVVDGVNSASSSIRARKWYEPCRFYTDLKGFLYGGAFYVAINSNYFKNMEPAAQAIMIEGVQEAYDWARKMGKKDYEENLEAMRTGGLKIHSIEPGTKEHNELKRVMGLAARNGFSAKVGKTEATLIWNLIEKEK